MAKCDICGNGTALPFTCTYCGGTFCDQHRLPENHSCKKIGEAKQPEPQGKTSPEASPQRERYSPTMEIRYKIMMPETPRRRASLFRDYLFRQANMAILFLIVAVFIIQSMAEVALGPGYYRPGDYNTFLYYLTPSQATVLTRPWTLITSIFAHGGFLHLLVNMIVLASLGPVLELRVGRRRFVYVFLGSGILAAAAQLVVIPAYTVVLGASGAIFGVLGALTVLVPRMPVLLLFFIPLRLWMATLGFAIISVLLVFTDPFSSIANLAHFTGILVGLIYGYRLRRQERRLLKLFRPF